MKATLKLLIKKIIRKIKQNPTYLKIGTKYDYEIFAISKSLEEISFITKKQHTLVSKKSEPMKYIFYILIFIIYINQTFGQALILTKAEVQEVFNDSVKNKFKINYNIFRVYSYIDNEGKNFIALTEKVDSITPKKDTLSYKIRAIKFKNGTNGLEKQWEVSDFILKEKNEKSIWFWTKYCQFADIDKDGIIDPIVVYGTNGANGYDDSRIKIWDNGQKEC